MPSNWQSHSADVVRTAKMVFPQIWVKTHHDLSCFMKHVSWGPRICITKLLMLQVNETCHFSVTGVIYLSSESCRLSFNLITTFLWRWAKFLECWASLPICLGEYGCSTRPKDFSGIMLLNKDPNQILPWQN